jgi:tRNA pseudouridine55 synthase
MNSMVNNIEFSLENEIKSGGAVKLIDKPAGITSFDVVRTVRRYANIRKVGHAGSLDPFATGLLIVCLGIATKSIEKFMGMPKEYEGVFVLGKATDTYDCEGNCTSINSVPELSVSELSSYISPFLGTIEQLPPLFSALKYKGVALYKYARKGEFVPRSPRLVTIYDISVLWFQSPRIGIHVRCGKGTYIRSLAHDLGAAIGCGAYVESLRRTKIGEYSVQEALPLERFQMRLN